MGTKGQRTDTPSRRFGSNAFPLEECVVFGNNVERIRTDEGLSITRFCEMAGISRPTLYKIERGESDPRLSMMVKIAKALGVSVEDLLNTRWWEY